MTAAMTTVYMSVTALSIFRNMAFGNPHGSVDQGMMPS
jgi:hypothetical protein